jgi:glycosyltransferase involved in cell wall biosynthesis
VTLHKSLVSLCCSTHSRPDLFPETLDGLLRQTYAPLEIVVLVDGAHPASIGLLETCTDPRLRWFATPEPSGMIAAWNKVVAAARGKYFLYCADDDVLLDRAIDAQVELLEGHSNVGFCHADFNLIDDTGARIGEWRSHEGEWIKSGQSEWRRYLTHPRCCMQTCVIRRDLWEQAGGWDESSGYPGDNSLYLKLLPSTDVGHTANLACSYRIRTRRPDSWAKNAQKVKDDFALAIKHLESPPGFARKILGELEREVGNHAARNAIAVLADRRGTPAEITAFRSWIHGQLVAAERISNWYRLILRYGMQRPAAYLKRFDEFLRGLVRTVAAFVYGTLAVKSLSQDPGK